MDVFFEQLLNGLTLGALYAMVAVGLALIFGVAQLVNFAHGSLYMVGAYLFYVAHTMLDLNYWVTVPITVLLMVVFGFGFERIVVRPILTKPWFVQLVATLASSIVLTNLAIIIWGSTIRQSTTSYTSTILEILGLRLSLQRLFILIVAGLSFIATHLFITHTKTGKAMRAMSQNREACVVVGIDVQQLSHITFGLSAGLAGLASAIITPLYSVYPTVGTVLILKAFAAIIMGGMGNVRGAIYASFLLGIVEALTAGYISSAYKDAVGFVLMLLVLFLRPSGFFGRRIGL